MRTEVHIRRPFGAAEEDVEGWRVLRATGAVGDETAGLLPTLVVYAVRRGARNVCMDLSELERVDPAGVEACAATCGSSRGGASSPRAGSRTPEPAATA